MSIIAFPRSQSRVYVSICVVLICFSTALAPSLFSQSASTGALTGTVKDSSGASVANATVTLTSLDTNQTRTATTGAEGSYKFGFLPPGAYKLQIEATGFNTAQVPSITIIVTETAVLDQALAVGTQTQQVVVTGEAEQIQTASASVGTLVGGQTLVELPLTTRNYTTLLGLAAGANVSVYNATQLGRGTQDPVVNGAFPTQNNYQQDGASLVNTGGTGTGADSGGATTGIGIVNPDSIQEFKIQTSSFDAGYGRNAGANVNVVTKSGTNELHGTAFEFFRNTILNANDFFRNQGVAPNNTRLILNQNQFGGSVGGPVKKDKLFFFASYQRTWQKNGAAAAGLAAPTLVGLPAGNRSSAAWVAALGAAFCPGGSATALMKNNGKTQYGGTQVSCDGSNINPVALNVLRLQVPGSTDPNGYYVPGSSTGENQAVTLSEPAHYFENQGVGNVDYVINKRNTFSGRYFYSAVETDATVGVGATSSSPTQGLLGSPGDIKFPNMYMVGKLTSIISTNVVNEVRASLQRSVVYDIPLFNNTNGSPVTNTQLGVTPVEPSYDVSDRFTISGLMAIGTGVSVARKLNTSWEIADQISWSHQKHTVRAGFEFERDRMNWYFPALAGGGNANLTFPTFADFLLGLPGCSPAVTAAQCSASQVPSNGPPNPAAGLTTNGTIESNISSGGTATSLTAPGGDNHFFRSPAANFFVQDDFKVSSRLTLNLGLRWEYNGLFYDSRGNTTNVWPNLINTVNTPSSLGSSAATGSLAGFVVPANFNASLYATPTVGGLFQNNQNVSIQNKPPIDAFAPRFGFAWRPLATDRFVVRGGAGIFYDRMGIAAYNSSAVQQFPYAVPVFQSSAATNWQADEAQPYPASVGATLGWTQPRWANFTTGLTSGINVNLMNPNFQVPTTYQWNLNTQYEFLPTWVLELGYVGSHSIHSLLASIPGGSLEVAYINEPELVGGPNANVAPGIKAGLVSTNTASNFPLREPYLGFNPNGLADIGNFGKDLFDSAQVTVRKQLSHGLTLQAAYTWARSLDTTDHALYNDPTIENYGPSSYYRPQRLTVSYGWDIPSGQHTGFVGKLANGWNVGGVTIVQDGLPLTIVNSTGGAVYGLNGSPQTSEAEFAAGMGPSNIGTAGSVKQRLGGTSSAIGYFNTAAFLSTVPSIGAVNGVGGASGWGNTGIGNILGPGQFNFDTTLVKTTRVGGIHENATLVFRTEFFNTFNHAQFNVPTSVDVSNSSFGHITTTSVNPRLIQFALKYIF